MKGKILFVDDDNNILSSFKRQFHNKYDLHTVDSGEKAISIIEKEGPFAIVISDYRMPKMNGADFLSRVRQMSPNTVRLMLTGQADMDAVINIINDGQIFRFLTKPCPPEMMNKNIQDGLRQYQLIASEKILLEKTLSGCIKILTDILTMVSPKSFSRASRVRTIVKDIVDQIKVENPWQYEIAAMLSQIGCVTVPDFVISKVYNNENLLPNEYSAFLNHPKIGSEMVANIPRLKLVSKIIAYQEKLYNGVGVPKDNIKGNEIPLGARVLKLSLDFDSLIQSGMDRVNVVNVIKQRCKIGWYDEKIVLHLEKIAIKKKKYVMKELIVTEIVENMILAEDLYNKNHSILIGGKGQEITNSFVYRLINIAKNEGLHSKKIKVYCLLDD